MIRKLVYLVFVMFVSLDVLPCWAQESWDLKLTYESKPIVKNSPFFLFATADLNKNGTKELIATDFGKFGNHIEEWKQWSQNDSLYTLKILEWQKNELKMKFQKQWDTSKAHTSMDAQRIFMAYDADRMVPWQIGDRVIVETMPPYLGIEWQNGKYLLREQQGWAQKEPLVASWVFPWLSTSCYQGFPYKMAWPRECLVGIRDFSGKGMLKIVSILEEEVVKDRQYKQTIRVRKFEAGYPIEWEQAAPKRLVWNDPMDRLNQFATSKLFLREFKTTNCFVFGSSENGKDYRLQDVSLESLRALPYETYDLPDIYIRRTQGKNEEYWGYRKIDLSDPKRNNFMLLLKKATLKPDLSVLAKEDIDFQHHEHFRGVGYFDVQDIDGDGLDEVVLVEETAGKLTFGEETVSYEDVKDYIHILKWDGTKYRTMWVSPPYTKRGTKFLVEDIKNAGKKQLAVLTPYGTVQIWERQK